MKILGKYAAKADAICFGTKIRTKVNPKQTIQDTTNDTTTDIIWGKSFNRTIVS